MLLFRCIGSLAFPLCCFLLVKKIIQDGFNWSLALSVLILAVIAEIPFDQLRYARLFRWNEQNPVFALLICILLCGIIRSESLAHTARCFGHSF